MRLAAPRHLAAFLLVLAVAAAGACAPGAPPPPEDAPSTTAAGAEAGPATVVVLVRHAEKEAEPAADPPLTAEGSERAAALADLLADLGVDRVLSTDYVRTRETAEPLARRLGVEVEPYDPRDLPGLADDLRAAPPGQRIVVVGHSNTTPEVARLLGGEPGPAIDEPSEYDRLYLLTLPADGPVTTLLLRYGRPSRPATTASR